MYPEYAGSGLAKRLAQVLNFVTVCSPTPHPEFLRRTIKGSSESHKGGGLELPATHGPTPDDYQIQNPQSAALSRSLAEAIAPVFLLLNTTRNPHLPLSTTPRSQFRALFLAL